MRRVEKLRKDIDGSMKADFKRLEWELREALGHGDGPAASGTIKMQAFQLVQSEVERMNSELEANMKKNNEICANADNLVKRLDEKLEQWHNVQDSNAYKLEAFEQYVMKQFKTLN